MKREATFDETGCYRYRLTRQWNEKKPTVAFVMLNPSTADAEKDDPTIRKCVGFASRIGAGGIIVVNLFAYRATDPEALIGGEKLGIDVIGPENDDHLKAAGKDASRIIAAWGKPRANFILNRAITVEAMLAPLVPLGLECLGTTMHGDPRHPLYVAYNRRPMEYRIFGKSTEEPTT